MLAPGEYPVRLQVISPGVIPVFERTITVTVPPRNANTEPPLAVSCFSDELQIEGPPGRYRFLATFARGAAATGGQTEFYLTDLAQMPPVEAEVVLWGEDPQLAAWLKERGIRTRRLAAGPSATRDVILASGKPAHGGESFRELARRMARGATVVFLTPETFAKGNQAVGWLPLVGKGSLVNIVGWLYLKDEWAKRHPIFDGLPAGGLTDYTFYRELIPDAVWAGQEPPAEAVAGAIKASQDYSSGLMVSVYDLGAGRFILNSLRIRQNLGRHPAAERLLRNMLRYAAVEVGKPVSALPDDFDAQLKAMGYQD